MSMRILCYHMKCISWPWDKGLENKWNPYITNVRYILKGKALTDNICTICRDFVLVSEECFFTFYGSKKDIEKILKTKKFVKKEENK